MNKFEHHKHQNNYFLYIVKNGENKPIEYEYSFRCSSSSYSDFGYTGSSPARIELVDSVSEATKSPSLLEFINWVKENKNTFNSFLECHEISIDDIKFVELEYQDPIEKEDPLIKMSHYIR